MRVAAELGAGRVPVAAAVPIGAATARVAREAERLAVDALLLLPTRDDLDEVERCVSALAEETSALGVLPYRRPTLQLGPADLDRLCSAGRLVGMLKDDDRDVLVLRRLRLAGPGLVWVPAREDVALPFGSLGCDAFAPASTASAPRFAREGYGRLPSGEKAGAARLLQAHSGAISDLPLSRPNIELGAVKAARGELRLSAGPSRSPAAPLLLDETVAGRA
jgi:dihydrodipicolinate synthase/N-acetylneuraminate lyase